MFADWLDEHGQSNRAEFIRLHIAYCRPDTEIESAEGLDDRLVEAWRAAGLDDLTLPGKPSQVFDRGFVAGLCFEGREPLRERFEAGLRHTPTRVAACWNVGEPNLADLAESELIARLDGVCCWDSPEAVGRLLESPRLAGLSLLALKVDGEEEGVATAKRIASAEHLGSLTVLDLDGTHVSDEGLAALAASPHLGSVRKLTLGSDGRHSYLVGEPGVRALVNSMALTRLTHLSFHDCSIDGASLRHLLRWEAAPRLVELSLAYCDISGEDIADLARSPRLRSLRRLCLSAFELTDAGIDALIANALPSLRELFIHAPDEYGGWDDQTPEKFDQMVGRMGARLRLGTEKQWFELGPVGDADRVWGRLKWLQSSAKADDPARVI